MANPGSLASMMFEIEESEDSLSESEFQGGGFEETIDTPTTIPSTDTSIQASASPTSDPVPKHHEWGNAETQYYCVSALSSRGGNLFRPKIGKQCECSWLSIFHWRPVVKGCI